MATKSPDAIALADPALKNDLLDSDGSNPFQQILVGFIEPHPANPRRITDDHPSLTGLADSIRTTGLIQPITVRQHPKAMDHYQILAGERRWRAVKKAFGKDAYILARVVEVTDDQAFDILTVENLQREGLHWLEEARGVAAMLERGRDAETIAKSIGRSAQWVALRAKLSTVSPKWQKEVDRPDGELHGWPMAMLEIVARLPISVQDEMLKDWNVTDAETVAELQKHVDEKYLMRLKAAPWNLGDSKLVPKAGACSECPKRSSCQQNLFADTAGDRCTDASCWDKKATAHLANEKATLAKLHPGLKTWSREYSSEAKADFQGESSIKVSKQGAKGAMPLLVVSGDGKGSLVWGQKYAEMNYSTGTRALSKAKVKGEKLSIDERMKALERKRSRLVCEKFVKWFRATKSLPMPCTAEDLVAIAASVGTHARIERHDTDDIAKALDKKISRPGPEAAERLWLQIRQTLLESIEHATKYDDPPTAAVAAVTFLDTDWRHLRTNWIDQARKEILVPKALQADIDAKGTKPKAKAAAAR